MQSSKTLEEAIRMVCKYWELFSTLSILSVEESEGHFKISNEAILVWQHQYPESARQSIEFALGGVIKIFRLLSGKKIYPVHVRFAYPARSVGEYEHLFHSPIHFNSKNNTVTFRKEDLRLPVISYDQSLFEFFNKTLEVKLNSLTDQQQIFDKIKHIIIHQFKGRAPSIEIMASNLNMAPRSLQRKLKEEGISYRDIVNDLKKELAQAIMQKSGFRVGEVAEILGYADSSSFRKAYKQWGLLQ
jgi:AraC-like DNA-binding protein